MTTMWKVVLLFCLQLCKSTAGCSARPIYMVTIPHHIHGGTMEKVCAHLLQPNETISFTINLLMERENLTLLEEKIKEKDFYKCIEFQVPMSNELVGHIEVRLRGNSFEVKNKKKVLITPIQSMTFIQTDKPIYKPGQTVKFRIFAMNEDFLPVNEKYTTVELVDPRSNRIGQWLNISTNSGIVDLSYPTTSEAPLGMYTLIAWQEQGSSLHETFNVKEYVLPKYEVVIKLPETVTIKDTQIKVQVCGKYTYGKPVVGSVKLSFCRKAFYYWFSRGEVNDICKRFIIMTDKSGCTTQVVELEGYALNSVGYENSFRADAELTEEGTGVTLQASSTAKFTHILVNINFEDTPNSYKQGIPFKGKIKVNQADSSPVANEQVFLDISTSGMAETQVLNTDGNGVAFFSLNTSSWGNNIINLQAYYKKDMETYTYGLISPSYLRAYFFIKPFYSKSKSFVKIQDFNGELECETEAKIITNYIIKRDELEKGATFVEFFYQVVAKGGIAISGRLQTNLKDGEEGSFDFTFPVTSNVSPYAQVLIYAILPSGEMIADSNDFKVKKCFKNKVELRFSSPRDLPGGDTNLHLQAKPGSLCSVRSVDKSVLLMDSSHELTADVIYNRIPVQKMNGYSHKVDDYEPYLCFNRFRRPLRKLSKHYFKRHSENIFSIFKSLGLKLLTYSDENNPVTCLSHVLFSLSVNSSPRLNMAKQILAAPQPDSAKETVRKFFPETWIWNLISVGETGVIDLPQTVPDTITEWQADAFCTSPEGFGLAHPIGLTAFQPFFVELTLPYSVVRGEAFQLKASVFNYLSQCIVVKVSPAESSQYNLEPCEGCEYKSCVCADESKVFHWTFTAKALGEVNITVRAEALNTEELCGNEAVAFPDHGRADTVIRKLLVEAEGVQKTTAINALLCPKDEHTESKTFSLELPEVFVEGSAKASVSVLGDVMGRAMQNLDKLLAMPFGCGEQNMLLFAPNIYILRYLEATGQMTEQIKAKAIRFMESGYQRELNYKHMDGSYSAFGNSDESGNTWLTAFVMKSFSSARRFIFIDPAHISDAKKWLGKHQLENGCFQNVGKLFHSGMKGGINDEISLTAYITTALLELKTPLSDFILKNSLSCLRSSLNTVTDVYTKILLSYMFTLARDEIARSSLLSFMDKVAVKEDGFLHWEQSGSGEKIRSVQVEMTSYVLLSLLSAPPLPGFDLTFSSSIVQWLVHQQNSYGGFSSTQDTVVALQALALYAAQTYKIDGSSTLTISSAQGFQAQFHLDQSNRLLYQERTLPEIPGTYSVQAEGDVCSFVQLALEYNVPPPPNFSIFNITAEAEGQCNSSEKNMLHLKIVVGYNGNRDRTNMVIVNVKLLSGYQVDMASISILRRNLLVKRIDKDKGYIDIYLEELVQRKSLTLHFTIQEEIAVKNMKPATVRIYDYYQTNDHAEAEYRFPCTTDGEEKSHEF
ncbi:alpha-2-macroglobulin-like protein 1 isoform X1 [Erpetoichthys calabaricus]|uniref:alpha-2-macroglobulin-like protein 1 isoform X1 n=1 Tax=Erpetoichthys calabaricus TaxID=27687 RepID=UPI002234BC24|nr:alpha-2-macroglobulin-like protein 1 isoform X1 [Erpetoichthys calabaricus]